MMKYRDRLYLTALSRLTHKGENKMKYPIDKAADIAAKLYLMQPYYCRNITAEQILVRCESEEELNF